MNLVKLQQSGLILYRLLKGAEKMGNQTMSVSVPELELFQGTINQLWEELNQARTRGDNAIAKIKRIQAVLGGAMLEP